MFLKRHSIILFCFAVTAGLSCGATLQFQATLTPGAVVFDDASDDPSASTASGIATFTLTTDGIDGPQLSYTLDLNGLTFDTELPRASSTGADTLVRAVHFHFGAAGTNGIHALNVYGVPREDDDQLSVSTNSLSGNYDDTDQNFGTDGTRDASDSIALTEALTDLQNGDVYIQVHTFAYRDGELRGQIVPVPEPTVLSLIAPLFGISLFLRRRKK